MKRISVGLCIVGAAIGLSPVAVLEGYPAASGAPGPAVPAAAPLTTGGLPTETFLELLNETGSAGHPASTQGPGQDVAALINAFISGTGAIDFSSVLETGLIDDTDLALGRALLDAIAGAPTPTPTWSSGIDSILKPWVASNFSLEVPSLPADYVSALELPKINVRAPTDTAPPAVTPAAPTGTTPPAVTPAAPTGTTPAAGTPTPTGTTSIPTEGSLGPTGKFSVDISGLPTDRVSNVSWTKTGQLTVTVSMFDYNEWQKFFDDFVINGRYTEGVSGTLSFLSNDLKTETGWIDFFGLTPVSIAPKLATGGDQIAEFVVTFESDTMRVRTPDKPGAPSGTDNTTPPAVTPTAPADTTPTAVTPTAPTGTTPKAVTPAAPTGTTPPAVTPAPTGTTSIPTAGTVGPTSSFKVEVSGLRTDRVSNVSWTKSGQLTVTVSMEDFKEWGEWFDDYITQDRDTYGDLYGRLTFLTSDLKTDTGWIEFFDLVPMSIKTKRFEANSDEVAEFVIIFQSNSMRVGTPDTPSAPSGTDNTTPPAVTPAAPTNTSTSTMPVMDDLPLTVSDAVLQGIEIYTGSPGSGDTIPLGLQVQNRGIGIGVFDITAEINWWTGDSLVSAQSPPPPGADEAMSFVHNAALLLDTCALQPAATVCDSFFEGDELPAVGTYFIAVSGFLASDQSDYDLTIALEPTALLCTDAPATPWCDVALELFNSYQNWGAACMETPDSTACTAVTTPATALARTLGGTFENLPDGATVVANDGIEIRQLPDQAGGLAQFALTRANGDVDLLITGRDDSSLLVGTEATIDTMGNTIYTLPGGETITAPGAGVEIVDITENPGAFASTPSELAHVIEGVLSGENTTGDGEPTVAAIIVSNGLSTGPNAFEMRILNSGKPAVVRGLGVVLEAVADDGDGAESTQARLDGVSGPSPGYFKPIVRWASWSSAQPFEPRAFTGGLVNRTPAAVAGLGVQWAEQIRSLLDRLPEDHFTTVSASGYCLEKNVQPPADGEIYLLADAGKQRRFGASRSILGAGPRARRQLNSDSDPDDYYHSILQWAIWVHEEGFNEQAFTDAFVQHTRDNVASTNMLWTEDVERLVRQLSPNRFHDIQTVLKEAGVPPTGDPGQSLSLTLSSW